MDVGLFADVALFIFEDYGVREMRNIHILRSN